MDNPALCHATCAGHQSEKPSLKEQVLSKKEPPFRSIINQVTLIHQHLILLTAHQYFSLIILMGAVISQSFQISVAAVFSGAQEHIVALWFHWM